MAAYYLPRVITPVDAADWTAWLSLAAPQVLLVQHEVEAYSNRWDMKLAQLKPGLDADARQVGELSLHGLGPGFADAVANLRDHERKASLSLIALDTELFSSIDALLADSQRDNWMRVRNSRNRVVGHAQPFFVPGAPIDLCEYVVQLNLSDDLREKVEPTLAEYDAEIAPVLLRLRDQQWKDAARLERLTADIQSASQRNDPGGTAALLSERTQILKSAWRIERQLATINRDYCTKLQAVIPLPFCDDLVRRYLARAYPAVFPDTGDPTHLLAQILDAPGVDADRAAAGQALLTAHRQSCAIVNNDLCAAQDEADDAFASEFTSEGRDAGAVKIAALIVKRKEVHRAVLEQVISLLPADVAAQHARELKYARSQVAPPK